MLCIIFISFFIKYTFVFYFFSTKFCAVLIAWSSLSQTLPTKIKRITPLCHILSVERPN